MQVIAVNKRVDGSIIESICYNKKMIKKNGFATCLKACGLFAESDDTIHTTTITITHK